LGLFWGNLHESDFTRLSFFTEQDGKMISVDRSIFLVMNSDATRFELPRFWRDDCRPDSGGKAAPKMEWNGAIFIKD
jgi:hypothetical protein